MGDSKKTYTPPVLTALGPTVVHVLRSGFALCGFSLRAPAAWPHNHRWIAYTDPTNTSEVTCTECREELAALPKN